MTDIASMIAEQQRRVLTTAADIAAYTGVSIPDAIRAMGEAMKVTERYGDIHQIDHSVQKLFQPLDTNVIDFEELSDRDATVVMLTASIAGRLYNVTGSAKRKPGDRPNPVLGRKLALARALQKLSVALIDEEGYEWR